MTTTPTAIGLLAGAKTDAIAAVIARELEQHRDEIDADLAMRALTISVRLTRSGAPRAVIVTRESERDLMREA